MKKVFNGMWKVFKFGVKAYIAFVVLVLIVMAFMVNSEIEKGGLQSANSEKVSAAKQRQQEGRSLFENPQLRQAREMKKILEDIK